MQRGLLIDIMYKNGKKYIKCKDCEEYKELNESNFYKDNTSIGYKRVCKACKKKYYIQNRAKRLAYQNEYNREKKSL